MIDRLLCLLADRARRNDGAIALMTITFMIFLGLVMVVFLWTIGYAGGAYNTMQGAAQATAYAAAGAVNVNNSPAQPQFDCNNGQALPQDACINGATFNTAERTLHYALASTKANFGLFYDPSLGQNSSVYFTTPDGERAPVPTIYAHQIDFSAGLAKSLDPSCTGHADYPEGGIVAGRSCWKLYEQGIGEPQYVSGVSVYLATVVQVPGCVASWCPQQPIQAVAAASQDQDLTQDYGPPGPDPDAVVFTSGPAQPSAWDVTEGTLTWTAPADAVRTQCQMDGSDWYSCDSGAHVTFDNGATGNGADHRFRVRVSNGGAWITASYEWRSRPDRVWVDSSHYEGGGWIYPGPVDWGYYDDPHAPACVDAPNCYEHWYYPPPYQEPVHWVVSGYWDYPA